MKVKVVQLSEPHVMRVLSFPTPERTPKTMPNVRNAERAERRQHPCDTSVTSRARNFMSLQIAPRAIAPSCGNSTGSSERTGKCTLAPERVLKCSTCKRAFTSLGASNMKTCSRCLEKRRSRRTANRYLTSFVQIPKLLVNAYCSSCKCQRKDLWIGSKNCVRCLELRRIRRRLKKGSITNASA